MGCTGDVCQESAEAGVAATARSHSRGHRGDQEVVLPEPERGTELEPLWIFSAEAGPQRQRPSAGSRSRRGEAPAARDRPTAPRRGAKGDGEISWLLPCPPRVG